MDIIYDSFLSSLGVPKKGEKGPVIEAMKFDDFRVTHGSDRMSLAGLAELSKWCDATLRTRAHQLDFFATYHPDSPRFWRKGSNKPHRRDRGEPLMYTMGLDLEEFIESENKKKQQQIEDMGFYIPDNYELAKKALAAFGRKSTLSKKIKDVSFRDTAMWESEDQEAILAFGNFIQEKYVNPVIKTVLKSINAKDVKFSKKGGKNKLDFVYEQ